MTLVLASWKKLKTVGAAALLCLCLGLAGGIGARADELGTAHYLGHIPNADEYSQYMTQHEVAPEVGDYLWVAYSWDALKEKSRRLNKLALRLIDLEVTTSNDQTHYFGVWRAGTGRYAVWTCPSWDTFNEKWQDSAVNGLQLVDIEVYRDHNGETRYLGLFREDMSETELWRDNDWNSISQ